MIKYVSLFSILLLIFSTCCVQNKNNNRKPVSKISLNPKVRTTPLGSSINIAVNGDAKGGKIDSLFLYVDNQLLIATNQSTFEYKYDTFSGGTGQYTIMVKSKKKNGLVGKNYLSFLVVSDNKPELEKFDLINTYQHSSDYFTEGLEYHDGLIFEGTGEYGKSGIFIYNLLNSKLKTKILLDDAFFGEGITLLNNKIYQLTYKAQKGFIYDANSFEKINEFSFPSKEGWGLTNDGENLIMSDGTSILTWINPANFQVVKKLDVCDHIHQVNKLNELEYIEGIIYANIWTTNRIAQIDATSGKILKYIDLSGIVSDVIGGHNNRDVLNGIAWKKESNTLLVTGKYWPTMYEIKR